MKKSRTCRTSSTTRRDFVERADAMRFTPSNSKLNYGHASAGVVLKF